VKSQLHLGPGTKGGHGPAAGRAQGRWRPSGVALLGSLLLVSWGSLTTVRAQPPTMPAANMPAKRFLNKTEFALPILIDARVQPTLREIQLYFKDNPGRPWTFADRAAPTQKEFRFRAPKDGEYWFTIVTVDRLGRATPSPAQMAREPAGVIVVVDTKPPQVELHPLPVSADGACVQCLVRDDNLDPSHVRFEFQTKDEKWRPLDALPARPDTYRIPPEAAVTGKVRVQVSDQAGNTAMCEAKVDTAVAALPAPAGQLAPMDGAIPVPLPENAGPIMPASHIEPAGPSVVQALPEVIHETRKVAPPRTMPQLPLAPVVAQEKTVSHEQAVVPMVAGARQVVNSRRVFLTYSIDQTGPSGVGKVQIWMTRDRGQSWECLGEDPDRQSPAEVLLPGEGLFGVTLVVSNGRGFGANPPAPGDAPDWWIEVDLTKPVAELISVQPSKGSDPGVMVITWNARDKNLGPEPVDLYWSANRDGPWMTIAKGVKNDRQYRWSVPQEVGSQAYVRLTVTDLAKNVSESVTPEAVPLDDLSRPRIRVVGVSTAAPGTGNGPELLPER
jgi:hypothetical protein